MSNRSKQREVTLAKVYVGMHEYVAYYPYTTVHVSIPTQRKESAVRSKVPNVGFGGPMT